MTSGIRSNTVATYEKNSLMGLIRRAGQGEKPLLRLFFNATMRDETGALGESFSCAVSIIPLAVVANIWATAFQPSDAESMRNRSSIKPHVEIFSE